MKFNAKTINGNEIPVFIDDVNLKVVKPRFEEIDQFPQVEGTNDYVVGSVIIKKIYPTWLESGKLVYICQKDEYFPPKNAQ